MTHHDPIRTRQKLILCADDFGLAPHISAAIGALAQARRISATSAIVTGPDWPNAARDLARLRGNIAIGLHLNLTDGKPLGSIPRLATDGRFPTLPSLLGRCLTGQIDLDAIAREFGRQLEAFVSATGYAPDFVDGHQHVHALPSIRRALLRSLKDAGLEPKPLLRVPSDRIGRVLVRGTAIFKSLVLKLLSAGFERAALQQGFPVNDGFSGVSDFDVRRPYGEEFARFTRVTGAFHIIMCHPGLSAPGEDACDSDAISRRREQEFAYLAHVDHLPDLIWHPDRSLPAERFWHG